MVVVLVCVSIYATSLFFTLWYLPRCFTIGEVMVLMQSLVLLAADSLINVMIKVS